MKWLLRLGSMRFAFQVIAVIVGVCIAGTVWPEMNVFSAWWFLLLLGLLVASLLVCGARQIRSLRRAHGARRGRLIGSLLLHGSLLAIFAGAAIRGIVGQRGSMELHVGETINEFKTTRGQQPLPFAVTLWQFSIDTEAISASAQGTIKVNWPGSKTPQIVPADLGVTHTVRPPDAQASDSRSGTIRVVRYVPDFAFDRQNRSVSSLSNEPNNPAIQVEVAISGFMGTNWVFANFPGFRMPGLPSAPDPFQLIYINPATSEARAPIKNFRSTVSISEGGREVYAGDIAVNAPLAWHGYTLYQSGYNPDHQDWSSLMVVRDPGVPVVFVGFGMLLVGLFLVLFVWPEDQSL